jgi:glyoxylate/hydroxypyruvate reductase A
MRILFHDLTVPPEPWLGFLRQAFPQASVELWQPGAAPADYALVWAPPQQLLDEQTQLKALFQIAAGVDALLKLRLPIGVPVFRLDDAGMAVQMAEYVCHAVIRHFRELDKVEADTRAGRWQQRQPRSRAEFSVGVLGLGVLGQRVLKALEAFEFPLRGWGRTPRHLNGVQTFAGPQELPGFLAASRVLVNLLPLTPETENLLNTQTLSQLQPGGYLINVARGRHLVDEDLLALLGSGHLAGATLDVFRQEPLPPEHAFWRDARITLTPHTSARTLREDSLAQIVAKIRALEAGAAPQGMGGLVRLQVGY